MVKIYPDTNSLMNLYRVASGKRDVLDQLKHHKANLVRIVEHASESN